MKVALAERNTEDYGMIAEEAFRNTTQHPLSTFSIDVDTAAYTIVRRHLREGKHPPKDAVRIEEMLNFFRYHYPNPAGDHPFSVTTELAACPWNSAHRIVHIGLKSRDIEARDLPQSNLTFLIDVSGSMAAGNKLALLKKSFALLVEQLRPQDKVAIVVYAGAAGLVLDSTSDRTRILEALERLEAGGSTAGAEGIELAYATAHRHFLHGGNNRVILATDGDFNVGIASDEELVKLIERERRQGVSLTVLGYGMGNTKDARMEALARHGNGNYAYIDNILEARRVLVEQMGATLHTVAKDVKLQVAFHPARVKGYRLIGYENRRLRDEEFRDDRKDAGDLGAGHSVTALYEIEPTGMGEGELLTVNLRYKRPVLDQPVEFAHQLTGSETAPSEDLRFALAVTEFGLLLRDSAFRANAQYARAIAQAERALGDDRDGRRAEFLALIKQAQRLPRPAEASPAEASAAQ